MLTKNNPSFVERYDFVLLSVTLALIVFGIMMIASATQGAVDTDLINRVPDQINYAIIGIIVMFALTFVDYRLWSGISGWLYIVMVVLLLMVRLFGVEGDGGAQRWLNIGIRIQPSEIGKILLIICLASFMTSRYRNMDKLSTVFKALFYIALPTGLVFIQPNLGMTMVYSAITATILWGSGLRLKHIGLFITVGLIALPLLFSQLQPYQLSRILKPR